MRRFARVTTVLLVLSSHLVAGASWPGSVPERMGLPLESERGLEVRVWLGGGIVHPFSMYRIRRTEDGVVGAYFKWDRLGELPAPYSERELRKAHARTERILKRLYCGRNLERREGVLWCEVPLRNPPDWGEILRRLQPDRIRELPPQGSRGTAECVVMDGTIVTVEVIDEAGRAVVGYANPQECCPWPACEVMENVMTVWGEAPP